MLFDFRSEFLKTKPATGYFFTLCWALLMFVFMGEEISWGQRIFDIATPDAMKEINVQNEINIHNTQLFDTFLGGKYRYLSVMMSTIGFLLPCMALTQFGKQMLQRFSFPVPPLRYAPLFIGAYIYGKYYHPVMANDAAEERELLMAIGMLIFALTGALSPGTLFRTCNKQASGHTDSSA